MRRNEIFIIKHIYKQEEEEEEINLDIKLLWLYKENQKINLYYQVKYLFL